MMNEHLELDLLSAYADGELTGTSRLSAERHLGDCDVCREKLHRLRELVHTAAALPRDVAPPEEAWQGIQRQMRRRPRRRVWVRMAAVAALAAAAAILAVAGPVSQRGSRSAKMHATRPGTEATLTFASIDRSYRGSIDELRSTLDQQRGTLSPSTVRVLDRSMAVIDTAIAEARAALAGDPANQAIAEILSAQYEQKVSLLQRATKLSPST